MKPEYEKKFRDWKEDLLRRLDERLEAATVAALRPRKVEGEVTKGNTVVTVRPMEGYGDAGWEVLKNGLKIHAFFGKDAGTEARSYANKLLNGLPTDQRALSMPASPTYDRGATASNLSPCIFCGRYYGHREECPSLPKPGPSLPPSGSK